MSQCLCCKFNCKPDLIVSNQPHAYLINIRTYESISALGMLPCVSAALFQRPDWACFFVILNCRVVNACPCMSILLVGNLQRCCVRIENFLVLYIARQWLQFAILAILEEYHVFHPKLRVCVFFFCLVFVRLCAIDNRMQCTQDLLWPVLPQRPSICMRL